MKVKAKLLAALAATAIGCGLSFTASADDGWKRHHRGHHDIRHGHHGHNVYGHVVHRPVVVARPVYVERPVYYVERPVYVAPPVHYVPRHRGIVVSVNIPPLVFPIH